MSGALTVEGSGNVVEVVEVFAVAGRPGLTGPGVHIGPVPPTDVAPPYMWFQTGLGDGSDFTIWLEDGT